MHSPVFKFWNMVVSTAVFFVLPVWLDLLPVGWLLCSSFVGAMNIKRLTMH